jgi:hypothetical protein
MSIRLCFAAALLCATLPGLAPAQSFPTRQKAPAGEELAHARMQVAEIYRQEYEQAKTSDQRQALAARMFNDARTTENDPAGRYALLLVARDVAVNCGDVELALSIIDQVASEYAIPRHQWVDEAIAKIGTSARPPKDAEGMLYNLFGIATEALLRDEIPSAQRIGKWTIPWVRKLNNRILAKELEDRLADLEKLERLHAAVRPSFDILRQDPGDPEANLAVGLYRCYTQERWYEGVAHLALGNDPELAALAAVEIADPVDAAELVRLADGWWELGEQRAADQRMLRRHAIDLYLQVLPRLDGLTRKRVEVRLGAAEQWHSKNAVYTVSKVERDAPLPSLVADQEKYHGQPGAEYAFRISDRNAFVIIDLKKEVPISRIYIQGTRGSDRAPPNPPEVYLSPTAADRGAKVTINSSGGIEWNTHLPAIHHARFITLVKANPPPPTRFGPGGGGFGPQGGPFGGRRGDSSSEPPFQLRKVKIFGPE